MIKTIVHAIFFCGLLLILPPSSWAASEEQTMMMTLPEALLAETIRQILPLQIDPDNKSFSGSIFINSIKNLQVEEKAVSALLGLEGKDIKIITEIAGHQLRLNLGTVQLDCDVTANIRYDQSSQTLHLKPVISDLSTSGSKQGAELTSLLISLFNGKEFPIAIQKLQPIITDTGSKQLAIHMQLQDVILVKDVVTLHILPAVQTILPVKP